MNVAPDADTGRRMNPLRVAVAFIAALLFAIAALVVVPIAP